jgi:hypothetical protein
MTVRTVAFITAAMAGLLMAGCGGKAAPGETAPPAVTIEDMGGGDLTADRTLS